MNKKTKSLLGKALLYLAYLCIAAFFLYPLLWVLSLSFKTVPELFGNIRFLPNSFHLDNYQYVLWKANIFQYLANSAIIVGFTIIGAVCVSVPTAYTFSRFQFPCKRTIIFSILFFQMISPLIICIPLYKYFSSVNLLNNMPALILVYIALMLPFTTLTVKGYIDTVPKELDEAATIDGCSRFRLMLRVVLPVIVPGLVSTILLITIKSWSQFIVPFILLDDAKLMPISVGLVNLQSTTDTISTHYLAAASMIGIIPTILIFIFLQRFIVSAMTAGSVKG